MYVIVKVPPVHPGPDELLSYYYPTASTTHETSTKKCLGMCLELLVCAIPSVDHPALHPP